jgi:hypothetical protein
LIDATILFKSQLRVNTDGAPNSYHPDDLRGTTKAINNIANGVAVYPAGKSKPLNYEETIKTFEAFRDNGWVQPKEYSIKWTNVLAAGNDAGRSVPCVFQNGDYKGYFGSLTALKNGLSGEAAGECGVANQLDERFMPALVIAGGATPVKKFGAKLGDLVVAFNPSNGAVVPAVIGDSGPPENLGEGSVALNMALMKTDQQPKTYADAKKLDTGNDQIIVAILPGTAAYKLQRPYTAANVALRVTQWVTERGYKDLPAFVDHMRSCESHL